MACYSVINATRLISSGAYPPFLRIQIVRPVADIFHPTERRSFECEQYISFGQTGRQLYRFAPQIGESRGEVDVGTVYLRAVQFGGKCQRLTGDVVVPFYGNHRYAGMQQVYRRLQQCVVAVECFGNGGYPIILCDAPEPFGRQ